MAPPGETLQVASRICGLHAQLMSAAELTLWARVDGLEPETVQQALWEERSLVKAWAMRGTLHLFPSSEYPMWQAALSTRTERHCMNAAVLRAHDLTRPDLERLLNAVALALDGKVLTRSQLADEVSTVTGSVQLGDKLRGSWGSLLKPAASTGVLCFAPSAGA